MKKGRFLLVGAFIMSFSVVFGQNDYAFKVLANKGTNEIKSGGTWSPVKTGAALKADDELKLAENSYIGLVHSNGKPLELKAAGNYKVADLASKVTTGTSVLNKYTDFILSSNSAEAKKNRLSATGAVTRGDNKLNVFLPQPQNASIFGKEMVVEWEAPTAGGPYIVTVKNIFDEELVKIETPETLVRLNLSDPKLANESAIMLEVSSKASSGIKSDAKVIKKLSPADFEKIRKSYAEISGDVTTESGFNRFLQAGFYEQHGLLIDALTSYEDAIKLSPDVEDFKLARDEFLYRNKLKKPKN